MFSEEQLWIFPSRLKCHVLLAPCGSLSAGGLLGPVSFMVLGTSHLRHRVGPPPLGYSWLDEPWPSDLSGPIRSHVLETRNRHSGLTRNLGAVVAANSHMGKRSKWWSLPVQGTEWSVRERELSGPVWGTEWSMQGTEWSVHMAQLHSSFDVRHHLIFL